MSDLSWISDTVKAVYRKAERNERARAYAEPLGEAGWPAALHRPQEPGDNVYENVTGSSVTAYRITGRDPGFPQHHPHDVPQSAIRANLRSFTNAFDIFFPDDSVEAYMKEKLELPALNNFFGNFAGTYKVHEMIRGLPRTHEGAKLDLRDTEEGHSFRITLEDDILFAAASNEIDSPERVRKDRKIITSNELETAYIYSRHKPELWVGFYVWQNLLSRYADELWWLFIEHDRKSVHSPQPKFLHFVEGSVENNTTFQVLFLSHIVALSMQRGNFWKGETLESKDIVDGINLARKNGIFRRTFDTPAGQRSIMCPFSSYGTRWLTMDMGGKGDPADSAIMRCYQKVLAEKDSNRQVKEFCEAVSSGLAQILQECDEAPRVFHAASAAVCPHASQPTRKTCPIQNSSEIPAPAKGPT